MMQIFKLQLYLSLLLVVAACTDINKPSFKGPNRTFESSFESLDDFKGFYVESGPSFDSNQQLVSDSVMDGMFSHKAWILKSRAVNNDGLIYLPHRAYPTIQFQKTKDGIFRTPCLLTLWVNLDVTLKQRPKGSISDWFSLITLTPDQSDNWTRTVVVNLTPDGYLKLVHVPNQGEQKWIYQADSINNPSKSLQFKMKSWNRIDVLIDFDAQNGYAKLWQNGQLVSSAKVNGGNGGLAQVHCGLYACAALEYAVIYNDKLRIMEINSESEALPFLAKSLRYMNRINLF
jgi:hypothetical protein